LELFLRTDMFFYSGFSKVPPAES